MAVNIFISDKWQDYEILDAGNGEKLERWGEIKVARPDPQIIWPRTQADTLWQQCHMHYHRSKSGGGSWEYKKKTPAQWTVSYNDLSFNIKPTDFKHMGLFPEQATNWDWAAKQIKEAGRQVRVLNLFGYTGGATVCCLKAGADVTHVDAAKGMNQWAKDNIRTAGMEGRSCRVFTDDVYKFVQREQRRGSFYEGIILDPPSYGRGPHGEVWKLENKLFELMQHCRAILSSQPLFILLNTYTTGFTATAAENVLRLALKQSGHSQASIISAALALPIANSGLVLPCGISVRCSFVGR